MGISETQKKKRKDYDQKTAKLTPEEMELRKENLEARNRMDDSALATLCSAVCLGAIRDYYKARKRRTVAMAPWVNANPKHVPKSVKKKIEDIDEELREIEEFFDTEMFTTFSGMSGKEETIRQIDKIPRAYVSLIERRDA